MIFIDQPDIRTKYFLEIFQAEQRELTKKEIAYLKFLAKDNHDLQLREATILTDEKFLRIRKYKAELILVKYGKSKTLKVMNLGSIPLRYQTDLFLRLSSDKTSRLNENKPKTVVNRFRHIKKLLEPTTIMERVLDRVVSE